MEGIEKAWIIYNITTDELGNNQLASVAGTDNYSELEQAIILAKQTVINNGMTPNLVVYVENIISRSDGKFYTDKGNTVVYEAVPDKGIPNILLANAASSMKDNPDFQKVVKNNPEISRILLK